MCVPKTVKSSLAPVQVRYLQRQVDLMTATMNGHSWISPRATQF